MTLDLTDYEEKAHEAVRRFWESRRSAANKQVETGKTDAGQRGHVTGGKTMDGFLDLMIGVVRANGLPNAEVHLRVNALTLPGFFRPTKRWDLLVMNGSHLVACVELKSHVGPSFGNNFNNRCEESIGAAHDFATACREGAFGDSPSPFAGWLILVEDAPESRSPVGCKAPHFPVREEFRDASYARRYDLLCRKLVLEKMYTAASVILSPREAVTTGEYSEMSGLTGLRTFVSGLAAHVAAESVRREA